MSLRREGTFSLDGVWSYKIDPDSEGIKNEWYRENADDWNGIKVPCSWYHTEIGDYYGKVWFKKHFEIPQQFREDQIWVWFGGVDYYANVWVNGSFAGRHEGYLGDFNFNITRFIHPDRKNVITVMVDSPHDPGFPNNKTFVKGYLQHCELKMGYTGPSMKGGDSFHEEKGTLGGIWGPVRLFFTKNLKIESLHITPVNFKDDSVTLSIDLKAQNLGDPCEADVEFGIGDVKQKSLFSLLSGLNNVTFPLRIKDPNLWWCWDQGDPFLYDVKTSVGKGGVASDEVTLKYGVRNFQIQDGFVWVLNGRQVFIRGVCSVFSLWLAEFTAEEYLRDLKLVRGMNANLIRLVGFLHPQILEMCDELGILVYQDFPMIYGYDTSPKFVSHAANQLREMFDRLYNHASIVLWMIHCEPWVRPGTPQEDLDEVLYNIAKTLDPLRPILKFDGPGSPTEIGYPGWYHGHYKDFDKATAPMPNECGAQALPCREELEEMFTPDELWPPNWEAWRKRNLNVFAMFKIAGVDMGNNVDEFIKNSQDYQAKLLRYGITCYRKKKWKPATGFIFHNFVSVWPSIYFCVIDYHRRPKKAYYTVKKAYSPVCPIIDLPADSYPTGANIPLKVVVVNDYPKQIDNAVVKWEIFCKEQTLARGEKNISCVPPDSAQPLSLGSVTLPDLTEGLATIKAHVEHEGKTLGEDEQDINVTFRNTP